MEIETARLLLVGADDALLRADLSGRTALTEALHAAVPEDWPPELLDEPALRWTLDLLATLPSAAIWRMYYVVLPGPPCVLIGACGYKGPPDADGIAEIGYGLLPAFWNRGFASEAASALITRAFQAGARTVAAETYPDLIASRRVMEKCGMRHVGNGAEAGVIRYERHAPA